tara:strand:- start:865 stop:1377 length:513 start_codon:yes stop_codon:yes gene_type:complete
MKKLSLILFSILIIFLINSAVTFSSKFSNFISGKVKVIDGDTIKIKGNNIRLFGIDAPEKNQICFKKTQPYDCGSISTKVLKKYAEGKLVKCAYNEKDKYGRIIGICYFYYNALDKKLSLNRYMVFTGNAVAYKRYSKEYLDDEKWAKNNQLGMWQGKFIRPEEWRRKTK